MNAQELHERCIYPAVRVRTSKAGGSGTLVYSAQQKNGDYCNLVLTNWHVVESAIGVKDDWDSLLKRKIKKEFVEQVTVETFDYVHISTVNSANSHRADIIAYDQYHDLAILKLCSPKPVGNIAGLIAQEKIKDIYIGTPVYCVGCSLLHDPLLSPGIITYLQEIIDNRAYIMGNANMIFGNSGGALYMAETGELIGVPSRVTVTQMGFGYDVQTWMGFSCHPLRLYEFFGEQELNFLYDSNDSYEEAMRRREKRQKEGLVDMLRNTMQEDGE